MGDPFSVNPIRRSALLLAVSICVVVGPWAISEDAGEAVMVSIGWLALTGIVFGIPILVISICEEAHRRIRARMHPPVEELDLTPRICSILRRHGYETVAQVVAANDTSLMLMSNMDERGIREIRRQLTLWNYREWQEQGFPSERPGS